MPVVTAFRQQVNAFALGLQGSRQQTIGDNGGPALDDAALFGSPEDPTAIANMRILGTLPEPPWPPLTLGQSGARLRDFLAGWVSGGRTALDTEVAAGVSRLAELVENSARWPLSFRPLVRVALCSIGVAPADNRDLDGDDALFAWARTLISNSPSEIVAAMSGAVQWA